MSNVATLPQKQSFSLTPDPRRGDAVRRHDVEIEHRPEGLLEQPGNVLVAVQWGMELGLQPPGDAEHPPSSAAAPRFGATRCSPSCAARPLGVDQGRHLQKPARSAPSSAAAGIPSRANSPSRMRSAPAYSGSKARGSNTPSA